MHDGTGRRHRQTKAKPCHCDFQGTQRSGKRQLHAFESESSIAGELKAEIYKQLAEGKTREEILAFFTARYGEQIRYDPALTGGTALLWAAPWVLFAAAGAAAFWRFKRRRQTNE